MWVGGKKSYFGREGRTMNEEDIKEEMNDFVQEAKKFNDCFVGIKGVINEEISKVVNRGHEFNKWFVATCGMIAGLGFTGISQVKSLSLFFVGEAILFFVIFKIIVWSKKIHENDYNLLVKEGKKYDDSFQSGFEIFEKIIENQSENPIGQMKKFKNIAFEIEKGEALSALEVFRTRSNKEAKSYSSKLEWFFIVGSILILFSFFIDIDWIGSPNYLSIEIFL